MLIFAVFDNQGPAQAWDLRHAHVVGPDDLVIPGIIEFADGLIEVGKRVDGTAAFGLQFPADPVECPGLGRLGGGQLTLRTCLLPERATPYLLSLELARRQLMQLLNKLEEWALFDRPADDPAMMMLDRAREAFTHALVVQRAAPAGRPRAGGPGAGTAPLSAVGGYSPEADREARRALSVGVAAGEAMALLHARVAHRRRVSGELAAAVSHPEPANAITDHETRLSTSALVGSPGVILPEAPKVGCRVNPAAFSDALAATVQQHCDFVCLPMRWVDMEPTEGKYAFAKTDRWIEWAVTRARLPVHAGPVLDFHQRSVPDFLFIWENDYETLRDVVVEYVKTIVTRYRRTVAVWNVASGLNCGGSFRLAYEQAIDLTRTCVALVKKLQPSARVVVELAMPWGEFTGVPRGGKALAPHLYAQLIRETQTPVDALGVRVQMGHAEVGRSARDLLNLSSVLDKLAGLELPISVTAMGAPSRPAQSAEEAGEPELAPGRWRGEWSDTVQAQWLAQAGAVVLSKPYVTSLCWQELYDAPPILGGDMPGGGLLTQAGVAKPALRVLGELRRACAEKRPTLDVTP